MSAATGTAVVDVVDLVVATGTTWMMSGIRMTGIGMTAKIATTVTTVTTAMIVMIVGAAATAATTATTATATTMVKSSSQRRTTMATATTADATVTATNATSTSTTTTDVRRLCSDAVRKRLMVALTRTTNASV